MVQFDVFQMVQFDVFQILWFGMLQMVQFDVFQMPAKMADMMLNLKINSNLVGLVLVASLYVDSMSYNCHFCDFW